MLLLDALRDHVEPAADRHWAADTLDWTAEQEACAGIERTTLA